jgi:hypothetical protein
MTTLGTAGAWCGSAVARVSSVCRLDHEVTRRVSSSDFGLGVVSGLPVIPAQRTRTRHMGLQDSGAGLWAPPTRGGSGAAAALELSAAFLSRSDRSDRFRLIKAVVATRNVLK